MPPLIQMGLDSNPARPDKLTETEEAQRFRLILPCRALHFQLKAQRLPQFLLRFLIRMPLVKRKPAKPDRRPALFKELGIDHGVMIPTTILDALLRVHALEEVRILACILRYSYGNAKPYAAMPSGRPMTVMDIARACHMHKQNAHSKVDKMIEQGWVKEDKQGRISITFRYFRIKDLIQNGHPFGLLFKFKRLETNDLKEKFFLEWESVETEEEEAMHTVREEYTARRERVKEKYGVEVERKRITEVPDDPTIEVRK